MEEVKFTNMTDIEKEQICEDLILAAGLSLHSLILILKLLHYTTFKLDHIAITLVLMYCPANGPFRHYTPGRQQA